MRVGVCGVGRMGAFHARTVAAVKQVSGVHLLDPLSERVDELAAELDAVAHTDEDALFAQPLDAVLVTAPTAAHPRLVRRALDASIPVFCEKPLTLDLDDSTALVAQSETADVPLQVGFQRRFDPGYARLRKLVRSGAIGTVYTFRAASHDPQPPHWEYLETSGNIFFDLHIHDFDVIRYVTGAEIRAVEAWGRVLGFEQFRAYDDWDTTCAVIELHDGTAGVLTGGRHNPAGYDVRMEVFGSIDTVAAGVTERTPLAVCDSGGATAGTAPAWDGFLSRFEVAYRLEMEHFLEVAGGRASNLCTAADANAALLAAQQATDTCRSGASTQGSPRPMGDGAR